MVRGIFGSIRIFFLDMKNVVFIGTWSPMAGYCSASFALASSGCDQEKLELLSKKNGKEISPLKLVGLFQHLPKEGEGVKKETEPGPKTNSPETIELPKELIDAWSPENGSSFQNRNHPDALKFRLPKEFKIIEEQLGELLTVGKIGKSSPVFGPDGLIGWCKESCVNDAEWFSR